MAVTTNAISGRVTRFDVGTSTDAVSVNVLDAPDRGYLTVDPGNETLSYVSTDPTDTGPETATVEAVFADGSSQIIEHVVNLATGPERSGWGGGDDLYMLRTDDSDEVVVETGETHRKVYASNSDAALGQSDIEALEGTRITGDYGEWLRDHPEYGGSEGRALDEDGAMALWSEITDRSEGPTSNWLLFERGYDYNPGRIVGSGLSGEDPLHPVHITSWGSGERPVIEDQVDVLQRLSSNVVMSDLELAGGTRILFGENLIFEDINITGDTFVVQTSDGVTLRQSEVIDAIVEEPVDGGTWDPSDNRIAGLYASGIDGLLIEQTFVDHTGWAEGYDPDGDPASGQPPSIFSHNFYLQYDTRDLTFRDNVSMRGASFGAQFRGGGYIEDNLFLDNNAAVNIGGGSGTDGGARAGNYTLMNSNVVTSGAHKELQTEGALTLGIDDYARMTSLVDNLIVHLANPDDPEEIARKYRENPALTDNATRFFDDTIVHDWDTPRNPGGTVQEQNTEGLDPATMDATTIQNYAAQLLGQSDATIEDLGNYWRALTQSGAEIDSDDVITYFQSGFGIETDDRTTAATVTFVPNELGEGTRWDNRLNWATDDLPGSVSGDSVDLNGSFVQYGGTTRIANMDFGPNGILAAAQGYLAADSVSGAGTLEISRAGQVWIAGMSGDAELNVALDGGRFVNDGTLRGRVEIAATDGEAILADGQGLMDVTSGTISITGADAKVGFDGASGSAGLRIGEGATLEFVAASGELGQIAEFRSGAFTGEVVSLVNLDGSDLIVDAAGIDGTGLFELVAVDALIGRPDGIEIAGLGARDAQIVIDQTSDVMSLHLFDGSGASSIDVIAQDAQEQAEETRLWDGLAPGSAMPDPEPSPAPVPDTDDATDPDGEDPSDPGDDGSPEAGDPAEPDGDGLEVIDSRDPSDANGGEEPDGDMADPDPVDGQDPADDGDAEPTAPDEGEAPDGGDADPETGGGDAPAPGDGSGDPVDAGPDAPASILDPVDPATRFDLGALPPLTGTDGDDRLSGADRSGALIRSGAGNDDVTGGAGADWIELGDGTDRADGAAGDDAIFGEDGDDVLFGGAGKDDLRGGDGSDALDGGDNDDVVLGGGGEDTLEGGRGADLLLGDGDDDVLYGSDGADILFGGDGHDQLVGGEDADQFVFDVPDAADREWFDIVYDFQGRQGDTILAVNEEGAEFDVAVYERVAIVSADTADGPTEVAYIFGVDLDALNTVTQSGDYTIFG